MSPRLANRPNAKFLWKIRGSTNRTIRDTDWEAIKKNTGYDRIVIFVGSDRVDVYGENDEPSVAGCDGKEQM